jgi:predicted  nucleic acid-binding Zn-ribbon protein
MSEAQIPTQAAGLFQKAHGKIVLLQRLDSQVASLLTQRRSVQDELNNVQSEINEEFDRLMHQSDELPAKILAEISGTVTAEAAAA